MKNLFCGTGRNTDAQHLTVMRFAPKNGEDEDRQKRTEYDRADCWRQAAPLKNSSSDRHSLSLNQRRDDCFTEALHLFVLRAELKQDQVNACIFKFAQLILDLRWSADKS